MIHFRLLAFFCLLSGLVLESAARRNGRRNGRRIGGGYLKPIDKNDPEVVSAARFAADKLNGTLVEVLSAQEQVVAGWLYHMTIHMKSSQHQDERCRIRVWVRHWINRIQLTKAECTLMHT